MKIKILDQSLILNIIENSIIEWGYRGCRCIDGNCNLSGIIMSHKTYYALMVSLSKNLSISFPSIHVVLPNGRSVVCGLDVIKTNDIDDDMLIFF